MKKFLKIFVICFVSIFIFSLITNVVTMNVNYEKNKKLWADYGENLIYSQKKFPNVAFGFGSMSKNGCAATCVYNVFLMENRYTPMPEIIKKFDLYGEIIFGFLGTDPFAFISIFQSYGFKVNTYLNSNKFNDYAKKSKYAIVMTVSTIGGHFQLMTNYNE